MPSGFNIYGGQGFSIAFENGCGISVQFGAGVNCANKTGYLSRLPGFPDIPRNQAQENTYLGRVCCDSPNAEVMLTLPEGMVPKPGSFATGDDFCGYMTPDQVGVLIGRLQALDTANPRLSSDPEDPLGLLAGIVFPDDPGQRSYRKGGSDWRATAGVRDGEPYLSSI